MIGSERSNGPMNLAHSVDANLPSVLNQVSLSQSVSATFIDDRFQSNKIKKSSNLAKSTRKASNRNSISFLGLGNNGLNSSYVHKSQKSSNK
jgi:hypothetical protein